MHIDIILYMPFNKITCSNVFASPTSELHSHFHNTFYQLALTLIVNPLKRFRVFSWFSSFFTQPCAVAGCYVHFYFLMLIIGSAEV